MHNLKKGNKNPFELSKVSKMMKINCSNKLNLDESE